MRTMLLSFKPMWYERIKEGSKIFEYRRTFCDEEVMAYMYVSNPIKCVVGKIHLGKRININTWREKYKDNKDVLLRIDDFLERHQYAMPVLSFQMTKPIMLEQLRSFNPNFVCPQMYYYLDNYPDLFEYIKNNASEVGDLIKHNFDTISEDDVCKKYY